MEFIPIYAGILGIFIAVGLFILVLTKDSGSGKITDIYNKIHLGAMTFIKREYSILFMFVAIFAILIYVKSSFIDKKVSRISFFLCNINSSL